MGSTQEVGNIGEGLAAEYLYERGFVIRHHNWRSGRHEIDIVAEREGVLHIIEVKCRKSDGLTTPEDAMTKRKFGFLCSAAVRYIAFHDLDMDVQFDLIAVNLDAAGGHELRYIPAVMAPRW